MHGRLHGLSVRCSKEEYEVIIMNLLQKYGFLDIIDTKVNFEDLINIVEESRNPKYGQFYSEHVGKALFDPLTTVYVSTCQRILSS